MNRWQVQFLVCLLGLLAGFIPCASFTGTFWELGLSQFGDAPVRIDRVTPGSPADQAGLLAGDRIHHPGGFDGLRQELRELQPGGTLPLTISRNDEEMNVEVTGASPQLAAIWYPHLWYPIAGVVFLGLGLLLYGTAPLTPSPIWRTVVVGATGLGLASGFAFLLVVETAFTRFRIWQRWLMGDGDDWCFGQGFVGIVAGVLLAVLAAVEARGRFSAASRN